MRHKNGHHNDRTGRESTSGKAQFVPQGLAVTHDLVRHAETKLVALHADRSQLRRRIRALHYLLNTLNTEFSSPGSADPASQSARPTSQVNKDEFLEGSVAEVSSARGTNEPKASPSAETEVSTELRRACRIALMESDRAQSCEQILDRIRRRESVCIAGFHNPVSAIAQELHAMLADYEVISKKNKKLWQLNRDPFRFMAKHNSASK